MSNFSFWDYSIFLLYLGTTLAIGFCAARGPQTMTTYFLAGRGVNRFIVAMTVMASLFSGVSFMSAPSEVYTSGYAFSLVMFAFLLSTPFAIRWLLPYFFTRRYFTAYEFLEERFSLSVRLLAAGLFILRVTLWLAAATYAPALALEAVTGLPLWFTILCTGLVTASYTVFGGMKAVIWTDVMQLAVLISGMLLIVVLAVQQIPGGFGGVLQTNFADHRFDVSFSFDPRERITFWGMIIGAAILSLVQMITDQISVQRYLTASSLEEAKRALWLKLFMVIPVLTLFYGMGLVLYAFYKHHGDPLAAGLVGRADQVLPFFVVTQLPLGLPGLMIAAIFAASMSTVSSGINSLTLATLHDFFQRLSPKSNLDDRSMVRVARLTTLLYGILITSLAFGISALKTNLNETVGVIVGLTGGPLLGIFLLAMLTRRANTRGALLGCLAGFAVSLFFAFYKSPASPGAVPTPLISFIWLATVGSGATIIVGLLVSRSTVPSTTVPQGSSRDSASAQIR